MIYLLEYKGKYIISSNRWIDGCTLLSVRNLYSNGLKLDAKWALPISSSYLKRIIHRSIDLPSIPVYCFSSDAKISSLAPSNRILPDVPIVMAPSHLTGGKRKDASDDKWINIWLIVKKIMDGEEVTFDENVLLKSGVDNIIQMLPSVSQIKTVYIRDILKNYMCQKYGGQMITNGKEVYLKIMGYTIILKGSTNDRTGLVFYNSSTGDTVRNNGEIL